MMRTITRPAALIALAGVATVASAANVPAQLLFQEGDAAAGSTIATVNAVYTSGGGTIGSLGILDDGRRFVWIDNGVDWTSDTFPDTVTGGESTIGVADDGSWDASLSLPASQGSSGTDDSWVHSTNKTLIREFDPAPGVPGQIVGFASRPTMDDNGSAYVVSGYRLPGDLSGSDARVFYKTDNPGDAAPTYEVVYQSFEVIDGFTVGNGGVDFTYDVSGNGDFLITEMVFEDTPTTADDNMVYMIDLNTNAKTRLGREGDATGAGDNFDNWDGVKVNNSGNYLIHGDTDGDIATDEFISYNGNIVYREGDSIGGVAYDLVDAADLTDNNAIVAVLNSEADANIESLIYGSDAGDASTWTALVTTGDTLDFDGNGVPDGTLTDFEISGSINPFEIGNGLTLWMNVSYIPIGGVDEIEAIVGFAIPAPGSLGVLGLAGLAAARRRR